MHYKVKARNLSVGNLFRLHVYGEVLTVSSVAGGKRIKVKIALEDQGQRANRGTLSCNEERKPELEFTDAGHTLEFLCSPGRTFHLIIDSGDGYDDDFEGEPPPDDDDGELEDRPRPVPEGVDVR